MKGRIVRIKKHPKFNSGDLVMIVSELPFNCYKIAGNLNHTHDSPMFYAHKNELLFNNKVSDKGRIAKINHDYKEEN